MGGRHVIGPIVGAAVVATSMGIAVAGAQAGEASTDRSCGTDPPVYEMRTFNRVTCTQADQVVYGLTSRFNSPGDFHGDHRRGIRQRDDRQQLWRCRWQSADIHHDTIIWACKRQRGVITWAWRFDG